MPRRSRTLVLLGAFAGATLATASTPLAAQVNVAAGKPVTLIGEYGALRAGSLWATTPLAAAGTVADGAFVPEQQTWNEGTVWWDADLPRSASNAIVIDLGGPFSIGRFRVQADNNDEYLIEYRLNAADPWTLAWTVPLVDPGYGNMTRPDFLLGAPVMASQLRVRGGANSDLYYSVAEVQAFATVPEPATVGLVGTGALALLGVAARRRRRA